MRKLPFILLAISTSGLAQVGINTTTPRRTLDINGDLRVRQTERKSTDPSYTKVLVTNDDGDVDYWEKTDLQNQIKDLSVETKKMYFSTSPSGDVIVPCGKFETRFSSDTKPQIRLKNPAAVTVYYSRIRKINGDGMRFENNNRTLRTNQEISSNDNMNSTWVDISTVSDLSNGTNGKNYAINTLDEYYLSYPGDANLYRITFLARTMSVINNNTTNSYTMICEKF